MGHKQKRPTFAGFALVGLAFTADTFAAAYVETKLLICLILSSSARPTVFLTDFADAVFLAAVDLGCVDL
jgi:hypothetical protein